MLFGCECRIRSSVQGKLNWYAVVQTHILELDNIWPIDQVGGLLGEVALSALCPAVDKRGPRRKAEGLFYFFGSRLLHAS